MSLFSRRAVFFLFGLSLLGGNHAAAWAPKQAPIMTKWAAQVSPDNALPEYPRPQMVRADWLNLNGVWQYQPASVQDTVPVGRKLPGEILVPFGVESALSGVMEHHDRLWYRRTFTIPPTWKGKRVLLHFGAVDYESEAIINGASVGIHKGGYDAFSYDITPQLKPDGPQEIIVRVFNPVEFGGQPRGKQKTIPGGIMYTPTTGIWQTVWLEPVADVAVTDLKIVPDFDKGALHLTVTTSGPGEGVAVHLNIAPRVAGSADDSARTGNSGIVFTGKSNAEMVIPIPNALPWSPEHPNLYDLGITIDGGDSVSSYFGMRKISVGEVDGVKRVFLNNQPIFLAGPLDQGFWPDGIYTAPTDEALKSDIVAIKGFGFNFVRKHIKVEPARWYYWADKLGLLVWQDMPSADSYIDRTHGEVVPDVDRAEFSSELTRMVQTHWNSPSIFLWTIFNEEQGQSGEPKAGVMTDAQIQADASAYTQRLVDQVRALDPSRLIDEASGGRICGYGDFNDTHSYPPPNVHPITTPQVYICGEFGGIGYRVDGHCWSEKGGGYTNVSSADDLLYLYADFLNQIKTMRDTRGLAGCVYTQLTDVMTEINGLETYDRVAKVDPALIARATRFELPVPTYSEVMPTSESKPQVWKYTTEKPAHEWAATAFDDSKWSDGQAGFGKNHGLGNTPWTTKDIWLRRHFNPGVLTAEQIANLVLRDFHNDAIDVSINGVHAYGQGGASRAYEYRGLTALARQAILPNADNVIAVHCLQKGGGHYIDAGLYLRSSAAQP
jgi:hypothetical protein